MGGIPPLFLKLIYYEVIQMSESFMNYPEIPDVTATNEAAENSAWMRKVEKKLKKHNKRLKRLQREGTPNKGQQQESTFTDRLGDAALKAAPMILTAFAAAAAKAFFSRKST